MNRLIPGALTRSLAIALLATGSLARGEQPAGPGEESGEEIDRIVAVVEEVEDGRVITLSELKLEAATALVQKGVAPADTERLDDRTLQGALRLAIDQRLLIAEANKVGAFQPTDSELAAVMSAFERRFESPAALERFLARHDDVDRATLREVLRRRLRAQRVLDGRVRPRAQVSETEVRRYYELHQQELVGTLDELRSALRDKLLRERYSSLAQAEVDQLRRAADVRLVAPPLAADDAEPEDRADP